VKREGAGLTAVGLLLCSNLKLRQSSSVFSFVFFGFYYCSFVYLYQWSLPIPAQTSNELGECYHSLRKIMSVSREDLLAAV